MSKYRWVIIALTSLAVVITYLDRSALSYAISPLQSLYHLNNADFGMIASAFGIGYLIMTVGGGIIVDAWGARKTWSLFSILWSLSCAALSLATGFFWLFLFRLLLGITEGPSFPSLTRVNADWLPMQERGRSLAIGLAAVPFASVIGAPLISHLITHLGWRWMFVVLGGLGIVWAIVWFYLFQDDPKTSKHVSTEELAHIQQGLNAMPLKKTTWRFMLFNPSLLANNYAFFVFGYLLFFAITWLPGYLEQTYGVHLKEAGWFLIAPWMMATVLILIGGWISDYLWKKTGSIRMARSHLIWICQILSALCFIPLLFSHGLLTAAFSITFGVGFGLMPNAAFYAINTDLAHDRAGTSLGIMDCAFALAGILAPLLTGLLSNHSGSFNTAFLLLIVLTFSSALIIFLFQHPTRSNGRLG